MTPREQTINEIRLRAAHGIRRPRRRLPRQIPPTLIGVEYGKAIIAPLERARVIAEGVAQRWVRPTRADTINDDFDIETERFFEQFRPRDAELLAKKFAMNTTGHADVQLKKQAKAALGVDVFMSEKGLEQAVEPFITENVALIRSVPNKYFDEIESLTARAVREGQRWEDLAVELEDRFGVAKNRAKLIARDQVGKLYGQIQEIRQKQLGVDKYIWRTVRDNRVRPDHYGRENTLYSWAKPPFDGHPGYAINCRCYPEPDFSDLLGD